jgi:hypothetical protein
MTCRVSSFGPFLLVLVSLIGCGGPNPTGPAPEPTPAPARPDQPKPEPTTPAPLKPADLYEMDPAKHAPPAAPASGRLGGKPFTPDKVELQGDTLTFRTGKEFFADSELVIKLNAKPTADGVKVTVTPTQKFHEMAVQMLTVSTRKGDGLPDTTMVSDGFALTLELGKKAGGKVPGKIHLALPGDGRNHLAGTFDATWVRPITDPPTDDDAPYIHGTVALSAAKGKMLSVGYVEIAGKEMVSDGAGTIVPNAGDGGGWVQSTTFKPRVATLRFDKGTPKFEFVKLPPGTYLVYARLKDGPVAWEKVEVKAGGQITKDLKLEAGKGGTVEVTTPADFKGEVRLAPADIVKGDDAVLVASRVAFSLDLGAEVKGGKATVKDVPPGKYTLFATPGPVEPKGTVEVTADKTATAEVKK